MKKILITAIAAMAVLSSYAQGTFDFKNIGGAMVKLEPTPGAALVNAPAGAAYQIGVYWAPVGTDAKNLAAYTAVGNPVNLIAAGTFFDPITRRIEGIAPGAVVSLQIRGWEVAGGSSYTAVMDTGNSQYHAGLVTFDLDTTNPNATPADPTVNMALTFPGLTMSAVPEPSTIMLGFLGLAGLFVLRRRS